MHGQLPPRPPSIFLDAARATASYVHNGLVEQIGGLIPLWCAFSHIQQGRADVSDKWSVMALGVSPNPVAITPNSGREKQEAGVCTALLKSRHKFRGSSA